MQEVLRVVAGSAVVGCLFLSSPSIADETEDAFRVCRAMDATGLTTECVVGVQRIDVTMDTNGAEARKICAGVVNLMAQRTNSFAGRWQLRILSPYSGENAIAVCTLR